MTDALSAGMRMPDGTSRNQVQTNKHVKYVVKWQLTDVLSAEMEVPDAPKIRGARLS